MPLLRLCLDPCFVFLREKLLSFIFLKAFCNYSQKDGEIQQWQEDKMKLIERFFSFKMPVFFLLKILKIKSAVSSHIKNINKNNKNKQTNSKGWQNFAYVTFDFPLLTFLLELKRCKVIFFVTIYKENTNEENGSWQ